MGPNLKTFFSFGSYSKYKMNQMNMKHDQLCFVDR